MSDQSVDPKQPDLDEVTNVSEQHAELSSASSREKELRENGLEPVSIWLLVIGAIIAIIAGGVIFQSNNMLSYDEFVKAGYVQAADKNGPAPIPQGAVEEIYMAKGKEIFSGSCAGCHGAGGDGGSCPPLGGSSWVVDSPVVAGLILKNGLSGKITVKGKEWNTPMPAIGSSYSDLEIASILYYIQNSFGNEVGNLYTLEQVAEIKQINENRSIVGACTAAELEPLKTKQVTGDFFQAGTIINKKTGEIIEAK